MAASDPAVRRVRVWDLPTRLFHWLLVVLVVTSFVTGKIGGNALTYHMWSGYAILALLLFRSAWGFIGAPESRFAAFVRGPGTVLRYARSLLSGQTQRHLGHNPLGGWSVVLMLLSLAVQAGTGLFANDDIATEGPLAAKVSGATSAFLTTIHHWNVNLLIVLVIVHLGAVIFYAFVKREDLVRPMVTGHKTWHAEHPGAARSNGVAKAAVVIVIAAAAVWMLVGK